MGPHMTRNPAATRVIEAAKDSARREAEALNVGRAAALARAIRGEADKADAALLCDSDDPTDRAYGLSALRRLEVMETRAAARRHRLAMLTEGPSEIEERRADSDRPGLADYADAAVCLLLTFAAFGALFALLAGSFG